MKKIEIWIGGKKLCETANQKAIENFEQIVRKAGYTIKEIEEKEKIIKMI